MSQTAIGLWCAGTAGVDELVAELSAKEDGSFRLFGYVGGVNSGVENLRGRMREVSAELERWQSSNAAQDSEHTRALQVPFFSSERAQGYELFFRGFSRALPETAVPLWVIRTCCSIPSAPKALQFPKERAQGKILRGT